MLNAVNVKVTSEMNQGLLAPFTHEEVKNALFSIGAALVWKSSLILWKWCKQSLFDFSATAAVAIFDEIAVLWKEFREISISHCNREVNIVAHELARQAFVQHNSQVWIDDPPSFIFHHLVNDVSILVNQ